VVRIEKPDPPVVLKVTHHSIELNWDHVKKQLSSTTLNTSRPQSSASAASAASSSPVPPTPTPNPLEPANVVINTATAHASAPAEKLKYNLQEFSNNSKNEWISVYSGYGTTCVVENLEPSIEYTYRLCVSNAQNERSEYSSACVVKTTSEFLFFLFFFFVLK
jgi:hypothetical protein